MENENKLDLGGIAIIVCNLAFSVMVIIEVIQNI